MRFRTDHAFEADDHARLLRGESMLWHFDSEIDRSVEPARPGDTWRVGWAGAPGAIAGYAICCPLCKCVHWWNTATNCATKRSLPGGGSTCAHAGISSCWTWTGSAEAHTLSAAPSLWCKRELGGCGFHGFLLNGILTP